MILQDNGTIINDSDVCLDCACANVVVPWGHNDDMACGLEGIAGDLEKTEARARATELLDSLTGHQFGMKLFRFMPGAVSGGCGCWTRFSDLAMYPNSWDYYSLPVLDCEDERRLRLPHYDVCQLSRIVFGGVEQDLEDYEIQRDELGDPYLVGPDAWPSDQDHSAGFTLLEDPETDPPPESFSWWVEYIYGNLPPLGAHRAANELACEFIKADGDLGDCALPANVTSLVRQGVTITIDPHLYLEAGLLGVASIDRWIRSVNPARLQHSASFLSRSTNNERWVTPNCRP